MTIDIKGVSITLTQEQLEQIAKQTKKEIKMFPQKDDIYWCYTANGSITYTLAVDDNGRVKAYRTEKEATKARDIAFAKMRVQHTIAVLNDGWVPDWENYNQYKYCFFVRSNGIIDYCGVYSDKCIQNSMYCKTRHIAKQVLEQHKDDLLLILSE